jgi:hypothetical protein
MNSMQEKYVLLLDYIRMRIPQFEVINKQKSTFMFMLSKILFFNKTFMSAFVTTIRYTVYTPLSWQTVFPNEAKFEIMAHELVHLLQYRRYKILQSLSYLMPQIFALLAVLSIFSTSWWMLSLLFLLPLPSFTRALIEFQAYRMSAFVVYKIYGNAIKEDEMIDYYVANFVKSNYYFMFPFKKWLTRRFEACYTDFRSGRLSKLEGDICQLLT